MDKPDKRWDNGISLLPYFPADEILRFATDDTKEFDLSETDFQLSDISLLMNAESEINARNVIDEDDEEMKLQASAAAKKNRSFNIKFLRRKG